jgi:hypothetical protein
MLTIEQAIFASANDSLTRGYQLVARSPGVDNQLARELASWAPSHGSLVFPELSGYSLNCAALSDRWAISRTAYGLPEYSARGAYEVVTRMLIFRHQDLLAYAGNAIDIASMAMALGMLQAIGPFAKTLPRLTLPHSIDISTESAALQNASIVDRDQQALKGLLAELTAIRQGNQVAVVGPCDSERVCKRFLDELSLSERIQISFATGLYPSRARPFQVHFIPVYNAAKKRRFEALGMDRIVWL